MNIEVAIESDFILRKLERTQHRARTSDSHARLLLFGVMHIADRLFRVSDLCRTKRADDQQRAVSALSRSAPLSSGTMVEIDHTVVVLNTCIQT